nr:hypothetical protein [Microcoleus sp. CAWBG58]
MRESLPELLSEIDEDDLLSLYFAGRGGWDSDTGEHYCYSYNAQADDPETYWVISSIFDDIEENFNGSKALLLADCCYSGGSIDEVKRGDRDISYACVTSFV